MPVLLADLKKRSTDSIYTYLIDEFLKEHTLLNKIPFVNVVNPLGGSAMSYVYNYVITPATAAFRELNAEYEANEAKTERKTIDLKIFGGAFQIDRVLARQGDFMEEVAFQMQQKIEAAKRLFTDAVINGNKSTTGEFDGLDKLLLGSSTELKPTEDTLDLSTVTAIEKNKWLAKEWIDKLIRATDKRPDMLLVNSELFGKLSTLTAMLGQYQLTKNDYGERQLDWGGIPVIDLGRRPSNTEHIVKTESNKTSLYAVRFGKDGFHAPALAKTEDIITYHLPDFKTAGAVKTGDVEMVCAVALAHSRSAGVLRNIKISA